MYYIKDIIDTIHGMSGRYSNYEIFTDWVKCGALMFSNQSDFFHGSLWQQREQEYIDTMKKYSPEERQKMVEMYGMLVLAMDKEITDVLGAIYMQGGWEANQPDSFLHRSMFRGWLLKWRYRKISAQKISW